MMGDYWFEGVLKEKTERMFDKRGAWGGRVRVNAKCLELISMDGRGSLKTPAVDESRSVW
jgi:hypothetical protein